MGLNRRTFLRSAAGAGVSAGAGWAQQAAGTADRPPNVLFLLFDKCRTDAIGAYGERDVHTPHLDSLAREGVRFANCYTPQALCGPARASILTGSYPHTHGLRRNVYPIEPGRVNSNYQESIADPFRDPRFRLWDNFAFLLNNAGYATGHIGKWHLGPGNPGFFDYWKSFNSMLRHWIGEPHKSRYRPDVHTDQGIRFIEEHAGEPFFLYQSYYSPHEPSDPPKQYLERYKGTENAGYYGSVTNLDWNVGRLLDALKRRNILDQTLIVMTTEHGRTWVTRPGTAEGMCIAYDDASRIPLLIRYPKLFRAGTVFQSGVSLVDLMPTILEAAGVQPIFGAHPTPTRPIIHGRTLINRPDRWDKPVVMQNLPQAAIDGSFYEERAIRTERYKLILRRFDISPAHRPGELYDMQADRQEKNNLYGSGSHRETLKQMVRTLRDWGREHRDEISVELAEAASGSV